MEQTPPQFAAHQQPSNKIAVIAEEDNGDDFFPSLQELRKMCDDVFDTTNKEDNAGGSATLVNAPRMDYMRYAAELPLKFYNDTNAGQSSTALSRSFELVKVCKINVIGTSFYGVTFKAKEGPRGDVLLFRGVVGGFRAVYCEIKDDDEIKLLPDDNDYVGCLTRNRFRFLSDDDDGDLSPEAEFEELKAKVARATLPWWERF